MTVFEDASLRHRTRLQVSALHSGAEIQDVSNATDAVIALLGGRFELILVDADWVGDLLAPLLHHVRRSSPGAKVLVFSVAPCAGGAGRARQLLWSERARAIDRWFAKWSGCAAALP